jgi:hypothetical protein
MIEAGGNFGPSPGLSGMEDERTLHVDHVDTGVKDYDGPEGRHAREGAAHIHNNDSSLFILFKTHA